MLEGEEQGSPSDSACGRGSAGQCQDPPRACWFSAGSLRPQGKLAPQQARPCTPESRKVDLAAKVRQHPRGGNVEVSGWESIKVSVCH